MKKIALLALLLVGCSANNYNPSTPKPSSRIAGGTTNDVMWVCSEEEINNSLVWIKCDFARTSNHDSEVCLKISYDTYSSPGWDFVSVRKIAPVCSGPLTTVRHEATKYVAFIRRQREALNEFCGNNLTKCTLTAHAAEP